MAKTVTDGTKTSSSSQQGGKKQRKQQAKREAKLLLKIEQAKKDVQKAEQKLAKAQANLEDARTQQHSLEQKVAELRTGQQQFHNGAVSLPTNASQDTLSSMSTTSNESNDQSASEGKEIEQENIPFTMQNAEKPPAEGRSDIGQEQDASSSQESGTPQTDSGSSTSQIPQEGLQVDVDQSSVSLFTTNPTDWSPSEARKEVAESVVEEVTPLSSEQQNGGNEEGNTSGEDANSTEPHRPARRSRRKEFQNEGTANTQLNEHYGPQSV